MAVYNPLKSIGLLTDKQAVAYQPQLACIFRSFQNSHFDCVKLLKKKDDGRKRIGKADQMNLLAWVIVETKG